MPLPDPAVYPVLGAIKALVGGELRFKAVDIGATPFDGGSPPYKKLLAAGDVDLVGFEPHEPSLAELNLKKGPFETYLSCAVGDGGRHTLRFCRGHGMSSLFEPNAAVINLFHLFPKWAEVVSAAEVDTVRLDDIPETAGVDFIKLDIQGGELMALQGAARRLTEVSVVQAETLFIPMYKDQPLFAEVDQYLRQKGFMLHQLRAMETRMVKPFVIDNEPYGYGSQVVWADAVFVRDLTRLDLFSDRQLLVTATIMYEFYRSFDVVLLLLKEYDLRKGINLSGKYMSRLQMCYPGQPLGVMHFEMKYLGPP